MLALFLKPWQRSDSFTPIGSPSPGFKEIYGNFKTASGNERQRSATRIQQHPVAATNDTSVGVIRRRLRLYTEPKDSLGALRMRLSDKCCRGAKRGDSWLPTADRSWNRSRQTWKRRNLAMPALRQSLRSGPRCQGFRPTQGTQIAPGCAKEDSNDLG